MNTSRWEERTDLLLGLLAGLVALVVYRLTLTPTVPFWDSGEFIACSYTLGIPHPPGTPLYVLLGRVFTLLPLGSIAERVNMLSAIPSALAVSVTYLLTARLLAECGDPFGRPGSPIPRATGMGRVGAMVAALVMAFSSTFWTNAIEAEVYALSSLVMVGSVYCMMKWRDMRVMGGTSARYATNVVVVVFYVLALSVAFHMGVFVVFLPLALFLLADHYPSLRDGRFVMSALLMVFLSFVLGFGRAQLMMSGALIAVLIAINHKKIGDDTILSLAVSAGLIGFSVFAMKTFGASVGAVIALVAIAAVYGLGHRRLVTRNLGFWVTAVFVVGLSVHLFLLIRAGLNPPINEADPSTLHNFWLVISRDQYKPGPPWDARGDMHARFVTHFWRYWRPQYEMGLPLLTALPFLLGAGAAGSTCAGRRATSSSWLSSCS